MGWTPVIETGSTVSTPQGEGKVRRVSQSNGTAQVEVNGQLFEVPLSDIAVKEGQPEPAAKPVRSWSVKPGDRVQSKGNEKQGVVTEVTQRSVKGKWDGGVPGVHFQYPKRQVGEYLDREQGEKPKDSDIKVGDKVKLTTHRGGSARVGEIGEVTRKSGKELKIDFPSQGNYSASTSDVEKVEEEKPKEERKEQEDKQQEKEQDKVKQTGDGLYDIFKLKEHLEQKIDNSVDEELKQLRDEVKKNQKLEVKIEDRVSVVEGLRHKQLEQLITYAQMRLSPLLVGMAGTGKTHAGEQTATALGLDFYAMSVGAQTSKSDIIGYMAANGNYVRTHFRDAYEQGGVFLMDEIDAGNANVLIQINAALSNGLCAFPDKMVKRHEDFVFIASANTFGNGANRQYVGRNQLDAATLDRFAVIEWFIDDDLEESLTVGLNGKAWYMAVRAARDYVAEKNIRALISPRATQKGSRLLNVGTDLTEVIHATMLGSVPDDKKKDVQDVATKVFEKFASEVPSKIKVSDLV